ncbi:MAG: hypothetical protein R2862_03605 [Thermoanaerobaculia bacterium]
MASDSDPADRATAPRGALYWLFLVVVSLLLLSTASGLLVATTRRADFVASFPGAVGPLYYALVATALLGLVALAGLLRFRRWAAWMYLGLGLVAIILDVVTRGPRLHLATAVASTTVVLALLWTQRHRFAAG